MAEVLLGRTTGEGGFEKLVAIKRILPSMAENESFVKMFIDEARISAKLNHSSIGQIFEFGKSEETYFIAMEYIQGVDLRAVHRVYQKQGGTPPAEMGMFIITCVCSALHYAHTRGDGKGKPLGLIHRDLSPSNVLISFNGEVKLIDFGIAKAAERLYVTVGANLKGKYAYMSPEQASGTDLDHRSDVFGVGTLLFELLTGRNPFRAASDMETLQRVQAARVPPPSAVVKSVPPELDAICLKALSQRPDSRFDSAADMQKAIETLARRTAFSSRRMSRFMREAFADEQAEMQQMLRDAKEQADAGNVVEMVTSSTDDLNSLFGPGSDPMGEAAALQHLATASLEVQKSESGQISLSVPPAQMTPSGVHRGPGSSPSSQVVVPPAGSTPSELSPPPGSTPSEPSISFVTSPGAPAAAESEDAFTLGEAEYHPPRNRRKGAGRFHVLFFLLLLVVAGVGIYFVFGDQIRAMRDPDAGYGTIRILVPKPAPAQIIVNGQPHGALNEAGDYLVENLLPGKHRVLIKGPGLKPLENVLQVVAGRVTEIQVFLSKAPPPEPVAPDESEEKKK